MKSVKNWKRKFVCSFFSEIITYQLEWNHGTIHYVACLVEFCLEDCVGGTVRSITEGAIDYSCNDWKHIDKSRHKTPNIIGRETLGEAYRI